VDFSTFFCRPFLAAFWPSILAANFARAADGRSLRATGRTELVNFRAHPRIKQAIADHIPKGKISLWLEEAIIAKLQADGVQIDA
jgi:hypothetical protein